MLFAFPFVWILCYLEIELNLLSQPLSPIYIDIQPIVDLSLSTVWELGLGDVPKVRADVVRPRSKLEVNDLVHFHKLLFEEMCWLWGLKGQAREKGDRDSKEGEGRSSPVSGRR
jgi:hypothetical protein